MSTLGVKSKLGIKHGFGIVPPIIINLCHSHCLTMAQNSNAVFLSLFFIYKPNHYEFEILGIFYHVYEITIAMKLKCSQACCLTYHKRLFFYYVYI